MYLKQTNMIWVISKSGVSVSEPTIPVFIDHSSGALGAQPHRFQRFWAVGCREKASWQQSRDHCETENNRCMCCRFGSGNLVKLVLLPHARVDKEVCFLSGQYICSCQQVGQQTASRLTLIQLNSFGLSIQLPCDWLPMPVRCACLIPTLHVRFLISVSLQHNWFYKHNRDKLLIYLTNYAHLPCVFSCAKRREDVLRSVYSWYRLITL